MYSAKKNVQVVVSLLKSHGIRHVVISPGSRNMSLVVSLENDPFFECYSVVDERSAAYFAIGVATAKQQPVVLSCTSAQASRNYIPGLTEAYYRGIPLVAITADFDQSKIGQGIMQTVDQMSLPKDAAKISVRLPTVKDDDDEAYCARLMNEALLELNHHGQGPVHINLSIGEHWDGSVPELPAVRKISRYTNTDTLPRIMSQRPMIAVGQHRPFSERERTAIERFAERHGAVVYTNHLSNFAGEHSVNGCLFTENMDPKKLPKYAPDLVISIGGQIGDYGFDNFVKRVCPEHWTISEDGKVKDTYGNLTSIFEMAESEFFDKMTDAATLETDGSFQAAWKIANSERRIPDDLPLSHAAVAAELAPKIPPNSVMHFAILSSLRNWNYFDLDPSIECYSNVAAFGIDGCMSTFMGHTFATEQQCFLIIGDLSFFYDMSALGIRGISANARVILVNNNGGGEFRLYSHSANRFEENANRHIAAAGHHGSARAWAESMGWGYIGVHSKSQLAMGTDEVVASSAGPVLMEVFTTMNDDSEGVRAIRWANSIVSLEQRLGRLLPPKAKRAVKQALGR